METYGTAFGSACSLVLRRPRQLSRRRLALGKESGDLSGSTAFTGWCAFRSHLVSTLVIVSLGSSEKRIAVPRQSFNNRPKEQGTLETEFSWSAYLLSMIIRL